jgi:hypothetical protein
MPINPNISLSFKPADPFTTIGSMLNIANAQQQYQQAQQLNPVQLQAAQETLRQALQVNPLLARQAATTTRVAEETAPFTIRKSESEAETAGTQSEAARLALNSNRLLGVANRLTGLINNPLIQASEQNPGAVDPEKLSGLLKQYGQEQASALGIPKDQADQLIAPYIE